MARRKATPKKSSSSSRSRRTPRPPAKKKSPPPKPAKKKSPPPKPAKKKSPPPRPPAKVPQPAPRPTARPPQKPKPIRLKPQAPIQLSVEKPRGEAWREYSERIRKEAERIVDRVVASKPSGPEQVASVSREFLARPEYKVRAVARDARGRFVSLKKLQKKIVARTPEGVVIPTIQEALQVPGATFKAGRKSITIRQVKIPITRPPPELQRVEVPSRMPDELVGKVSDQEWARTSKMQQMMLGVQGIPVNVIAHAIERGGWDLLAAIYREMKRRGGSYVREPQRRRRQRRRKKRRQK